MRLRSAILVAFVLLVTLVLVPLAAEAEQVGKVRRIGYLTLSPPERARHVLSLIEAGLRDLGYVPGKDVIIESYIADGERAAKQATGTIPIVMLNGVNPVGSGFVANLSRPGGNITGLAFDTTPDSTAKNPQLLKETVPSVSRVAVLWDSSFPGVEHYMAAVKTLAGAPRRPDPPCSNHAGRGGTQRPRVALAGRG